MTLMSVLLPLPFSPARQCTSPRPTEKDTSSSARTPPKRTDTCSKRIASEVGMEDVGDGAVMEVNASSGWSTKASRHAWCGPLPPSRERPAWSEPKTRELVDRVLVDRKEVVGDDVVGLLVRMHHPEPLDRHAVLDLLAIGQHLADADEHAARFGRIPH